MSRELAVKAMAQLLCLIAGIEPTDSTDGSPNWWMFNAEAERIVDGVRTRFPSREQS